MKGIAEVVGYLAKDLISGLVSVGVVNLLEAVEVEQKQGERAVGPAGAVYGVGEALLEETAVGQAGELVVKREPLVAGDLLLKHEQDHTDGDERLLHVPDVRGDVGVGGQ